MDDPQTAFPVINPVTIKEDYNPSVSEELLKPLGDMKQEDTFVLTTVRVPKDIQDMSINLKAPIIINMSNKKRQVNRNAGIDKKKRRSLSDQ